MKGHEGCNPDLCEFARDNSKIATLRARLAAAERVVEAAKEEVEVQCGWCDRNTQPLRAALAAYDAQKGGAK